MVGILSHIILEGGQHPPECQYSSGVFFTPDEGGQYAPEYPNVLACNKVADKTSLNAAVEVFPQVAQINLGGDRLFSIK